MIFSWTCLWAAKQKLIWDNDFFYFWLFFSMCADIGIVVGLFATFGG